MSYGNEVRAERAEEMLASGSETGRLTRREAVIDALTDLMHYADWIGEDFEEMLRIATAHYRGEARR